LQEQHLSVIVVVVEAGVGLLGQRLLVELDRFLALMEHENFMLGAVGVVVLVLCLRVLVLLAVEMGQLLVMAHLV
jgi:hypothetical protein